MGKIVAAINMTLDGFCDHTGIIPDEAMHQHYADLLRNADAVLYGRITYQLMEYWRTILEQPSGEPAMDDFARAIDKVPKIVFSHTLTTVDWDSACLAKESLEATVTALRQLPGKDIVVGSPSLIVALTKLQLLDEYQLCVHPVVAGSGLPLFNHLQERLRLQLVNTKTFGFGGIILYYQPVPQ